MQAIEKTRQFRPLTEAWIYPILVSRSENRKGKQMAFMDQKRKALLAPGIKSVLRKYGLKGSLKVGNHTSLSLTVTEGSLDFIGNAVELINREADTWSHHAKGNWMREAASNMLKSQSMDVNVYHARDHFTGICRKAILELIEAMNVDNYNESRPEVDYFNVGWYIHVNIGRWNKPYKYTGTMRKAG